MGYFKIAFASIYYDVAGMERLFVTLDACDYRIVEGFVNAV
jgi:hypothetical protein